jgi:hypothetical protein
MRVKTEAQVEKELESEEMLGGGGEAAHTQKVARGVLPKKFARCPALSRNSSLSFLVADVVD